MRTPILASLVAAGLIAAAAPAYAHFHLDAPARNIVQDAQGNPQKTAKCGGTGTATGAVTAVQTGGMLTVTITETILHPGHYRVAIAQDEASLPADPTAGANCAVTPVQNPTLPILADGLFPHTTAFSTAQTAQIQLPAGYTCNNCVVQVIQVMTGGSACFYYQCANVTISDNPQPMVDAGPTAGPDADPGTDPTGPGATSGGCSTGGTGSLASVLLVLGALLARRRRS